MLVPLNLYVIMGEEEGNHMGEAEDYEDLDHVRGTDGVILGRDHAKKDMLAAAHEVAHMNNEEDDVTHDHEALRILRAAPDPVQRREMAMTNCMMTKYIVNDGISATSPSGVCPYILKIVCLFWGKIGGNVTSLSTNYYSDYKFFKALSRPVCPWGVAGAVQVGASKRLDPLQQRADDQLRFST